jgi:hypothetical protein
MKKEYSRWFNCPLRYNHLKIVLSCLIVFSGVIFTRLQLEAIKSNGPEGNDFIVHRDGTIKKQFKNKGNTVSLKVEAAALPSKLTGNSLSSPLPKASSKSNESSTASEQDLVIVASSNKGTEEEVMTNFEFGMNNNATAEISEFTRQEGVVIVTKVHGPHHLALLKQSMCLLHQAYNKKVKYDIVVFTTVPITENEKLLVDIRAMISPVQLQVVLDNDGIVNEINKLSPLRRQNFLNRCNVTSPEEITWDSECYEEGQGVGRISYNWQAEFRSWHIWRHEGLRKYRYMMWIDTDAFCTQVWDRDPIAIAMKNRMVIYFNNYPQGRAKAAQSRVKEAFGKFICYARKSSNGQLISMVSEDEECKGAQLWTIHGFNHITDLDFFRQKQVIQWAEIMIGDGFLCRTFDDQLAVTVPSVILAPERSWDMYKSGVQLKLYHNNLIDGKRKRKAGGFHTYWKKNAESQFPEALNTCEITEGS